MTQARTADDDAARLLARRPLTRAELCDRLARRGHARADVDGAVARAQRLGWIDDAKLAYEFLVARSTRLGRGRARLMVELEARGVARAVADAAWRKAVELGEIDAAAALRKALRRRLAAGGGLAGTRYARVYNALLREGFERDDVESALEPHRTRDERPGAGHAERTDE